MKRIDEAMAHMQSKAWLCGPSKVAMRHDALTIVSLAPHWTESYRKSIRKAVSAVLEDGKEGFLLLMNTRSREGNFRSAAGELGRAGKRVQQDVFERNGPIDDQLRQWMEHKWRDILDQPRQRADVSFSVKRDGKKDSDTLLFTGVSPAYPKWHPRHFPMDALGATRMSVINAISAQLSERIFKQAGVRAGGQYSTGFFLPDAYEGMRLEEGRRIDYSD
jgi:hypothetical protein